MVFRWIRRAILFWIIFLVGLLVAIDFGARVIAQYVVARELQSSLALQDRPKVTFGGWPFLPELIRGDIATVTVDATGSITDQDFPVQSVDVALRDVQFSLGDFVSGGGQRIEAKSGDGTIVMTQDDVNAAIPSDLGVTVTLKEGKVLLHSDQVKGSIDATATVSGTNLTLTGDQLPPVTIALPRLADGLTFTDVTVTSKQAVLTFELSNATFHT
jgi:DUF2993 family protein